MRMSCLARSLAGWEGIEEEDGTPIVFSEKTLAEFADDPYWIKAVISAYTATYNERLRRETKRGRHLLGEWRQTKKTRRRMIAAFGLQLLKKEEKQNDFEVWEEKLGGSDGVPAHADAVDDIHGWICGLQVRGAAGFRRLI